MNPVYERLTFRGNLGYDPPSNVSLFEIEGACGADYISNDD